MWSAKHFYFGDNITVGVSDLDRAIDWYREKLGLQRSRVPVEEVDALLVLEKDDDTGVGLMKIGSDIGLANLEPHPILFSKKIEATREHFISRGISVGPLETDSGGNRFFQFKDLDGNTIEVCVEP